jgi:serine/threonine protein phosphatase PrpC
MRFESPLEELGRSTDEPDIRDVGVARWDRPFPWQVYVNVMEFVRVEPLETELRTAIRTALLRVDGVTDVVEEDREVWMIEGTPSGQDLLDAAASVVDSMSGQLRHFYNSL